MVYLYRKPRKNSEKNVYKKKDVNIFSDVSDHNIGVSGLFPGIYAKNDNFIEI